MKYFEDKRINQQSVRRESGACGYIDHQITRRMRIIKKSN